VTLIEPTAEPTFLSVTILSVGRVFSLWDVRRKRAP
jgi:hypothetical protein